MLGRGFGTYLVRRGMRAVGSLSAWGARGWSTVDGRNAVLGTVHGAGALGERVAVFCHFDRAGRIRPHTRLYIEALRQEGLAIVFVTNSGRLAAADRTWLADRAARIVERRNVGYDFAAWRDAMAATGLPAANTGLLLLVNDSVYGPLQPLGPVLQRIDFSEADVWGATDSWQHRFHLQSYFVAYGPRALRSEAFARFWRGVRNVRSKAWVVSRYEIGLTRSALAGDLRCRALWPYTEAIAAVRDKLQQESLAAEGGARPPERDPLSAACRAQADFALQAAARRVPLNPTADLWLPLLEQGFPFLKRELLRDNPTGVPDTASWPSVAGGIDPAARDIILHDLQRVAKNRAP